MYKTKSFLAIIPARGGSKRLPKKNILTLGTQPLISWSIKAALESMYIDSVVVTSDDSFILEISKQAGADIIVRPDDIARDTSSTFDAVAHVIENYKRYDYIVLLQATSPLRTSQQIDEAIELLYDKNASAIISVCETEHSPLWSNTLPENHSMNTFIRDDIKNKRSQDLEIYYQINGAIYICDTSRLLEEKSFVLKDDIFAYIMNRESSIDIDVEMDFKLAELYIGEPS